MQHDETAPGMPPGGPPVNRSGPVRHRVGCPAPVGSEGPPDGRTGSIFLVWVAACFAGGMASEPRSHRKVREARRRMFEQRGTVCHLCGHPGATEADHVIPFSVAPWRVADPENMRPVHGSLYRSRKTGQVIRDARCRTCGKSCNQSRGATRMEHTISPPDPNAEYERVLD